MLNHASPSGDTHTPWFYEHDKPLRSAEAPNAAAFSLKLRSFVKSGACAQSQQKAMQMPTLIRRRNESGVRGMRGFSL